MRDVEQLVADSRDARLQKLPVYAQQLIRELAHRMEAEHRYAKAVVERAEKETADAQTLLAEGLADSDTFMDLHMSFSVTEDVQRPLGQGVNIEFRGPDDGVGEGINARWEDGHLVIDGINSLAVIPVGPHRIHIERK